MKYFTDRPVERVMMQIPRPSPRRATPATGAGGMAPAASCPATGV